MIIALKPIKFDKQYGVGDTIPSKMVSPNSLVKLVSAGYLKVDDTIEELTEEIVEKVEENINEDNGNSTDEKIVNESEKIIKEVINEDNKEVMEEELEEIETNIPLKVLEKMTKSDLKNLLKVNQVEYKEKDTKEELINKYLNKGE